MLNLYLYKYNRFIKKVEKRFKVSFFFLSIFRIFLIIIEKIYFKKINFNHIKKYSNYYLKDNLFSQKNDIISAGIANENSFEQTIYKKLKINKMICIDPTDIAESTMRNIQSENVHFIKSAIYDKIEDIKIYEPFSKNNHNLSIDNLYESKNFKFIKTTTIEDIMKKFDLKKLDIVKLDIEGVADKVITSMIKKEIYPSQIAFEIERPMSLFRQIEFFKRTFVLINILKDKYNLYSYTKLKLGFRIEILATLKN